MNPEQRRRLKQQIAQKAEAGHRPGGTVLPEPADPYPPPPKCPACGQECVVWNGKSRCCGRPMGAPIRSAEEPPQPGNAAEPIRCVMCKQVCEVRGGEYICGCPNGPDRLKQAKKHKPPAAAKSPGQRDKAMADKGRLPHCSRFNVVYDEQTRTWSGTLTVATPTGQDVAAQFEGSAKGVFRLLAELDDQYRKWLAAQEKLA